MRDDTKRILDFMPFDILKDKLESVINKSPLIMSCGKRFYGTTIKPQSIFYSILLKAKLQPAKIK